MQDTTVWMQEVEQRREQLPRRPVAKPVDAQGVLPEDNGFFVKQRKADQ